MTREQKHNITASLDDAIRTASYALEDYGVDQKVIDEVADELYEAHAKVSRILESITTSL